MSEVNLVDVDPHYVDSPQYGVDSAEAAAAEEAASAAAKAEAASAAAKAEAAATLASRKKAHETLIVRRKPTPFFCCACSCALPDVVVACRVVWCGLVWFGRGRMVR